MAAKASGYALTTSDVSVVLGMVARKDRSHDIAAWFGVNQGRIKEAKDGKFGIAPAVAANVLPPKGAPGVKGRRLCSSVEMALAVFMAQGAGGCTKMVEILEEAKRNYNVNET